MKKKLYIDNKEKGIIGVLIPGILVTLVIVILVAEIMLYQITLPSDETSEQEDMLDWANERLDHYYADMERTLEGSRKEDDVYIFTFVTNDERQIEFETECWYGAYSTPWGSISFLKQRYFSDNFIEKLTEDICDGLSVDFTGYSTDGMIQWFKDTQQSISDVYAEYGDNYSVPDFTVVVTYEDRSAEITYHTQSDYYLEKQIKDELNI